MPTFYLVITQDKLHVYRQTQSGLEVEVFEGEPSFPYSSTRVQEDVERLENELLNNNNLDDRSALSFIVLLSHNDVLNEVFEKALDGQIVQKIPIDSLIWKAIEHFGRNSENHIQDLGINYDGCCFIKKGDKLISNKFSLLAYTVKPEVMLELLIN